MVKFTAPGWYIDGCTLFPNKLGAVSHKVVCDKHDDDYWNHRVWTEKLGSDFKWFYGVNKTHFTRNKFYWWPVSLVITSIGLPILLTIGSILWKFKPEKPRLKFNEDDTP